MTREQALSIMRIQRPTRGTREVQEAWDIAIEALKQPEQKWIPCSEQLPGFGEDVILSINGYCNVGYLVPTNDEMQYNWYYSGWYHPLNDVDAWMPLPDPYTEDNNNA